MALLVMYQISVVEASLECLPVESSGCTPTTAILLALLQQVGLLMLLLVPLVFRQGCEETPQ